jgi:hypothetical protein
VKTITFSDDQVASVRLALESRIIYLRERLGYESGLKAPNDSGAMSWRDRLDVAKQALAAVQA